VCISQFSLFSAFLAIFHVLQCVFLIFHDFQFYRHIPASTVSSSHFSRFWIFLNIFHVLVCVLQFFPWFSVF
jgi:hypothetical protein